MRDEYGMQVTRNGLMVVVMAHAVTKDDEGVDSLNERVVDVDVDVDVMNTPMRWQTNGEKWKRKRKTNEWMNAKSTVMG
jgi:hypothetical protein